MDKLRVWVDAICSRNERGRKTLILAAPQIVVKLYYKFLHMDWLRASLDFARVWSWQTADNVEWVIFRQREARTMSARTRLEMNARRVHDVSQILIFTDIVLLDIEPE